MSREQSASVEAMRSPDGSGDSRNRAAARDSKQPKRNEITNEEFVRQAYAIAGTKDLAAWVACFNPDGVFVDESVGVTYRGPGEVGKPVENYGTAFSDMHRELYDVYVSGDVVIVELALQGTGGSSCSTATHRER